MPAVDFTHVCLLNFGETHHGVEVSDFLAMTTGVIWVPAPFCGSWSVMDGGFLPSFLPRTGWIPQQRSSMFTLRQTTNQPEVGCEDLSSRPPHTHSHSHTLTVFLCWQCVYCIGSPSFRSLTRANSDTNPSHPISLLLGRTMTARSVLTSLLKTKHTQTCTQTLSNWKLA